MIFPNFVAFLCNVIVIQTFIIFLCRRRHILPNTGSFSPNANNDSFDVSSDFNASIRALPEDSKFGHPLGGTGTTHFGVSIGTGNPLLPTTSSPIKNSSNGAGQLDNLCQLEETDDEDVSTPVVESKPLTLAKITQV